MRRAFAVAFALTSLAVSAVAQEADNTSRILLFSKTAGYRHASIEPAITALTRLAAEHGFVAEATEDSSVFRAERLARFDAVVFLLTSKDVLDDAQQEAFAAYIRSGGGFAGVHSASDTEYGWAWYGSLVGAYFDGHPEGVRTGRLLVADPTAPATGGLPDPWVRVDEWYDLRDLEPGLSVLLEIDETSYKTENEDPESEPRPIAWFHEFDGGRSFYTALGHTAESYSEPLFLEHVWGGITMVMRRPAPSVDAR